MARRVSWLPRLQALCRTVDESVRSHYGSRDLERLFEVQPRSAQMLMNLMPTVQVGKSLLVEREALAALLGRLAASGDPAHELAAIRAQGKPPVVRRKLRELVQKDVVAGQSPLPANVLLEPGTLTVNFATVEELTSSLWRLAMLLEEDLDGFAMRYERDPQIVAEPNAESEQDRADAAFIRDWLAQRA